MSTRRVTFSSHRANQIQFSFTANSASTRRVIQLPSVRIGQNNTVQFSSHKARHTVNFGSHRANISHKETIQLVLVGVSRTRYECV